MKNVAFLLRVSLAVSEKGLGESGDDFTKFSTIYQWFQTLIHLALMQRLEKYPQTKTTPNDSVLQNVQPSDDITPLTQQAYYHLPFLVG
ncbi:Transposase, IS4 [Richelia intracellularis]|nr:Transposase, IS4 [Richelia intracellularis]